MLNLVFPVIGCSDGDAGQRVQDTVAGVRVLEVQTLQRLGLLDCGENELL